MLSNFIKNSWLVLVASLVFGVLVAAVYGALSSRIEENNNKKLTDKMLLLLAGATACEKVVAADGQGAYYVGKDAAGQVIGYALEERGGGFSGDIELVVTFNADLTALRGIAVLQSSETPGFGDKLKDEGKGGKLSFKDQFSGCPLDAKLVLEKTGDLAKADNTIVAISGATITSDAVTKIVNQAVLRMKKYLEK